MAASVSTIPAVLDALVQRWTLALPDAQVSDGQPLTHADDMVMVGFTGDVGEEAITADRSVEQMASSPDREQYTITCIASSWKGDEDDVKVVRDAAFGMLDAIAADLASNPTLDRLVLRTSISVAAYSQFQTSSGDGPGGVVGNVRFVVSTVAFTGR